MEREKLCIALCRAHRIWQELDGQARARNAENRQLVEKALQWAVGAHGVLCKLDAPDPLTPEQQEELTHRIVLLLDTD